IAEAIDAAFGSPRYSSWRSNIKSKRSELAWKGQGAIYALEMSKFLNAATNPESDSLSGVV
ncbi:hypothetical protein DOQ73_23280, partial [Salmonella enterica subsp. enterica]|nr:hypothetical protein [Salmonella enterica subsp. enterica serovar Javiana]